MRTPVGSEEVENLKLGVILSHLLAEAPLPTYFTRICYNNLAFTGKGCLFSKFVPSTSYCSKHIRFQHTLGVYSAFSSDSEKNGELCKRLTRFKKFVLA